MTRRTRGLLPITGDERQLCHALGLSDDFVRDLDDLLLAHTGRPLRGVVFAVLRKMQRAGCVRRLAPSDAAKPTTATLAKLDAALAHVADGPSTALPGVRGVPKGLAQLRPPHRPDAR